MPMYYHIELQLFCRPQFRGAECTCGWQCYEVQYVINVQHQELSMLDQANLEA